MQGVKTFLFDIILMCKADLAEEGKASRLGQPWNRDAGPQKNGRVRGSSCRNKRGGRKTTSNGGFKGFIFVQFNLLLVEKRGREEETAAVPSPGSMELV